MVQKALADVDGLQDDATDEDAQPVANNPDGPQAFMQRLALRTPPLSSVSQDEPTDLIGRPINDLRLDELKLLHHYMLSTSITINPKNTAQHSLWQHEVVEIAFQHQFLFRGVLAISAIHLHHLSSGHQSQYLTQASAHMSVGMQSYRRLLYSRDAEYVPALFIFSLLVTAYNLGIATTTSSSTDDTIRVLLDTMSLVVGVRQAIGGNSHILRTSPIGPIAADSGVPPTIQQPPTNSIEDAALENLLYLPGLIENDIDEEICKDAINSLRTICTRINNGK